MQSEEPVSMIQEIRLRKWARQNYVPAQWRCDEDWHPVVLDEMHRRDAELQEFAIQEATPVSDSTLRRRIERGRPGVIAPVSAASHRTVECGLMAIHHGD